VFNIQNDPEELDNIRAVRKREALQMCALTELDRKLRS
jgi:hypothetical protein